MPVADRRRSPRKPQNLPPINGNIRFSEVRVIGTDGEQLGIMSPREAQVFADEKEQIGRAHV